MEHDYRNDLYLINNSMRKKLNLRFFIKQLVGKCWS